MSETVLQLEHLGKRFGMKWVANDINAEINSGEVFGFLGPNGAGKTTTIKMIMGFLYPDAGKIRICGIDTSHQYEQAMANVGGIVENPEMYKELTGRCNLEMYARIHDGVDKKRIDEVVEMVGMKHRIDEKVKKYSLGMKQRIGVAQAILNRPKLLILDEPTNGLDPVGIKELRNLLKHLAHEEGVAVFVSSHMMSEMEQMCDRVGIISNGKLLGTRYVSEMIAGVSKHVYKFIVSDENASKQILETNLSVNISDIAHIDDKSVLTFRLEPDQVPQAIKLLVNADIDIYSAEHTEASLEDAFINMTNGGGSIA